MKKRGRLKGMKATKNALAVVCLLDAMGWFNREISEIFCQYHEIIRDCIKIGKKTFGNNFSAILVKSREAIKVKPSGDSEDLRYIFRKVHQKPCGGN